VFFVKAYAERSREKYIQAGIQACCALLQAGVTVYSLLNDNPYHRFQAHDAGVTLRNFVIDHFSMSITGYGVAAALAIAIPMAIYVACSAVFFLCAPRELLTDHTKYNHFSLLADWMFLVLAEAWHPGIGDPAPIDWVITFGYLATAVLCFVRARTLSGFCMRTSARGHAVLATDPRQL